jgi:hypothetical protein
VVFDGAGATNLEPDLAYRNEDLRWTPQITIAAGFSPDCAHAGRPGLRLGLPLVAPIPRASAGMSWSRRLGSTRGRRGRTGRSADPVLRALQWQLDVTT